MSTVNLLIKGKVQGVFFRAKAKETADKLNLTGWIKNLEDERVEAMVTGDEEQVEQFIVWCRSNPGKAVITDIIVTPLQEESFDNFSVIR